MGCYQVKSSEHKKQPNRSITHSKTMNFDTSDHLTEMNSSGLTTPQSQKTFTPLSFESSTFENSIQIPIGTPQEAKISSEESKSLTQSLITNLIFAQLSSEKIQSLTQKLKLYKIEQNEKICSEGRMHRSFFYVQKGSFQVWAEGSFKIELRQGECFGLLALVTLYKMEVNIVAKEESFIWVLPHNVFTQFCKRKELLKIKAVIRALQACELYNALMSFQQEMFVARLSFSMFQQGEQMFKGVGLRLFVVLKGRVSVDSVTTGQSELEQSEYFVRESAVHESVIALTKCKVAELELDENAKGVFEPVVTYLYKDSVKIAVMRSKIFRELSVEQKEGLVNCIKFVKLSKDEKLKNVLESVAVFVINGEISFQYKNLGVHSCLGDEDFYKKSRKRDFGKWKATCTTDLGLLYQADLERALGKTVFEAISINKIIKAFKKTHILGLLPDTILNILAAKASLVSFANKETIFKEESQANEIYILKEGRVKLYKNHKVIKQVSVSGCFGETCLIQKAFRITTAVSKGATCWIIHKSDLLPYLSPEIRLHLQKSLKFESLSTTLKDLIPIKTLGQGTFGTVLLCQDQNTKQRFALKSIHKSMIYKYEIYSNILSEKRVLMQLDHPFIVQLYKTFKCSSRVYFLLELVQGIELFELIQRFRVMDITEAKFYSACLVLILEYLHDRKIVFRDLKPENVIIDLEGFPKLIDFGFAKIVKGRTSTVLGTPHYMAPEVVMGKEYGTGADYWSLGVMLFEFLTGSLPFGGNSKNPVVVYKEVCEKKLDLSSLKNYCGKELIGKLLNRAPEHRGDCESIKKSGWFAKTDFEMVLKRKVEVPYKPESEINQEFAKKEMDLKVAFKNIEKKIEKDDESVDFNRSLDYYFEKF